MEPIVDHIEITVEDMATGATIVTPPRESPKYVPPGYYALFFKDSHEIEREMVYAG